jgi:beta-glucosidase
VLPPSADRASALIWVANPGMMGGTAIAELVLGMIEPIGRLPISFARHVGQQPTYYNQIRGQHGDRYADLTQRPAFAFGDGLSYTDVVYESVRLDAAEYTAADSIRVTATLRNAGSRPAHEVVQLYVRDVVTSVSWTDRELKAFRRVEIAPGETAEVSIDLPVAACTIVDAEGQRIVEAGDFEILVGPSSREETLLAAAFAVRR